MLVVRDTSKLLSNLPMGDWVAIAHDEDRVVAHGPDLDEVLQKADELGEKEPLITRVSEAGRSTLIL